MCKKSTLQETDSHRVCPPAESKEIHPPAWLKVLCDEPVSLHAAIPDGDCACAIHHVRNLDLEEISCSLIISRLLHQVS